MDTNIPQPKIERVPGTPFKCRICSHDVYCQVMVPLPVKIPDDIIQLSPLQQKPLAFEYKPQLFFCERCTIHFHAPMNFSSIKEEIKNDDENISTCEKYADNIKNKSD